MLDDQRDRLRIEAGILARYFPTMVIQGLSSGRDVGAIGALKTQSGRRYGLWLPLDRFPDAPPPLYVISPSLDDSRGRPLGAMAWSSEMHLLGPDGRGNPQICHHSPRMWHSRLTLYHVLLKGRLWLEAYEGHLRDGRPIDHWLGHM